MTSRLVRLCLTVASSGLLLDALAQNPPPLPTNPTTARPVTPTPAGTTPAAAGSDEELVQLVLPDADIDTVLSALEIYTGRIILRPQQLQTRTYNLKIKKPIPKSEAILAIETVLALNGIGVSPLGERFLKVIDLNQVSKEAPEMITGSAFDQPASGKAATKLFQLEFLRVAEFVPMIQQVMNPFYGAPVQLQNANAVLITDSVSNLQRFEQLLQQVDKPITAGMKPKFYSIHNVKASELVNKLRTILQGTLQNQLGQATTYSADDRTQQIVVVTDPRQWDFFTDLIERLDQKSEPNTRTDVLYLKHAKSKDVVDVLSRVINTQTQALQKQNSGSVRPGMAPTPLAAPGAPVQPVQPAVSTASAASNPNFSDMLASGSNEFSALMTVTSDERSNAVVVFGTSDDIRLVQGLIDKLDIVLAQVRIEVVILEVSLDDSHSSGISQLGLQVSGDKLIGFSGGMPGLSINGDGESGFASITRPGGTASVSGPFDLAGIISIGTTPRKNNTTVLSTPSVTTSHATKATFISSEKRPITTGTTQTPIGSTNSSNGFATSQQVTQQDIGVTLNVTPLIGVDGSVYMDIDQDVQDVAGSVKVNGDDQPIISHRQIKSFITARTGDIIVLGGMQRNKDSRQTNRLGPIPILGDIFGSRTKAVTRTELIFFLRPYLLTNPRADNAEMFKRIEQLPAKDVPQKDEIRQSVQPGFIPPKKSVLDKILPR